MNRYSFNIIWSEDDGEYVATCPAFPGLSALGETEAEALAEAKIALDLFIKTCQDKGIPLPESDVAGEYSGQFRVRLPKSLHRRAAQMAALDGVSLNQFVAGAVEARVGGQMAGQNMMREMKQVLTEHTNQFKVLLASVASSDQNLIVQGYDQNLIVQGTGFLGSAVQRQKNYPKGQGEGN